MHIALVGEKLPRLQIQFRISRSFRPRNLANLGSKIRFWIRRKEHTLRVFGTESHPFRCRLVGLSILLKEIYEKCPALTLTTQKGIKEIA